MTNTEKPIIVVKYSGEAMRAPKEGPGPHPIYEKEALDYLVTEIKEAKKFADLAIVVGGGNHGRGAELMKLAGVDRETGDKVGMLYTVVNCRILENRLLEAGVKCELMSAISCPQIGGDYVEKKAIHWLRENKVILLAGGLGHGGCSTDHAAVIRAMELKAKKVIKATKVCYLHESDPRKNPQAKIIESIGTKEYLVYGFKQILDNTSVTQAQECNIVIQIINGFVPGNLTQAVQGQKIGSLIIPSPQI